MNEITYEDFSKCDIRTGTIVEASQVPKSEKLLQLKVSFGEEVGERVIVAGIARYAKAELLVGQQVVAVLNLAPRKLFGIESHGMILATHRKSSDDLVLLNAPDAEDGCKIG